MGAMSNPYEQPPGANPPAPYGQPYGMVPREHPQGTVVLILGILGFFTAVTAPFAWVLGSRAMKEIRASGISYANEQQINIGRILGMVFTILYVVLFVVIIAITIVALVAASNYPR